MNRSETGAAVIQAQGVSKIYGGGVRALDSVDLEIQLGEVVCFVGPNGAGKTTLVRILATQLQPTSGAISVFGVDIARYPGTVRGRLAVVPQEGRPDPDRSPWHHVYYYGRARGLGIREAKQRTESVLRTLGLWGRRAQVTRNLSGGLRQRVLIGMVMVTEAPLLFLDEPTTGLDPVARRELWGTLAGLKGRSTVVLTTHYMEEAEALADRVALLHGGRVLAAGNPRELVATLPYRRKVVLDGLPEGMRIEDLAPHGKVESLAGKYLLYPNGEQGLQKVVDVLAAGKLQFSVAPVTLEDFYVQTLEKGAPCG